MPAFGAPSGAGGLGCGLEPPPREWADHMPGGFSPCFRNHTPSSLLPTLRLPVPRASAQRLCLLVKCLRREDVGPSLPWFSHQGLDRSLHAPQSTPEHPPPRSPPGPPSLRATQGWGTERRCLATEKSPLSVESWECWPPGSMGQCLVLCFQVTSLRGDGRHSGYPCMDVWVVATSGLLGTALPWACVCPSLRGRVFSPLSVMWLGGGASLYPPVTLRLTVGETVRAAAPFMSPAPAARTAPVSAGPGDTCLSCG